MYAVIKDSKCDATMYNEVGCYSSTYRRLERVGQKEYILASSFIINFRIQVYKASSFHDAGARSPFMGWFAES